jgi:hypothetical protein
MIVRVRKRRSVVMKEEKCEKGHMMIAKGGNKKESTHDGKRSGKRLGNMAAQYIT